MPSESPNTVQTDTRKSSPHWLPFYRTKPCIFFQSGNCRYGKRCRFYHGYLPELTDLINKLHITTILTGMQLEDVKEIIKNQNELLKEQAEEIRNLKTSLEFGLKPCNNDKINTHAYSEKSTQYEIFNHKVSVGVQVEHILQEKAADVLCTRKDDMKTQQPQPPPLQSKLKNALCSFFLQGNCKKEKSCNYAHEQIDVGEVVEWQDDDKQILLAKVSWKGIDDDDRFRIYANLIGSGSFGGATISSFSNRFRKKVNS